MKKEVIILSGPTGVGKSRIAVKLAERLNGEIISADSVQVYRGMNIGAAKVSQEIQQKIPHHLIDIKSIFETYNVVDFYNDAKNTIHSILERGKTPIIVGGTGFYLHALIYGPSQGPSQDKDIRKRLREEFESVGVEPLFERLKNFDPIYAQTISKNDIHKIERALEIIEISKQPVSSFAKEETIDPSFNFNCWFLYFPREILYPILDKRCDEMLLSNFLEEVIELEKEGIRNNQITSKAIGYKQCLEFLETNRSEKDYEDFVRKFKTATRNFAKRQFTWFRNKETIFQWLDLSLFDDEKAIEKITFNS